MVTWESRISCQRYPFLHIENLSMTFHRSLFSEVPFAGCWYLIHILPVSSDYPHRTTCMITHIIIS